MKNIFDAVKGGNFGNIGNTLNSALGGNAASSIKNAASGMSGMGGLVGSAAIGGLMGALFSGKKVKKMAKGALVVGGTAAAGALAWNFYQKWSQGKNDAQQTQADHQFGSATPQQQAQAPQSQAALPNAENTAIILLEAMVFAARADGHIDEEEKQNIHNATEALFPGQQVVGLLDELLQKPIDPTALAAKINNREEAHDLYRLSCAAIDIDSFMERSYLDGLAKALNLSDAEKSTLEQEAIAARQSMEA